MAGFLFWRIENDKLVNCIINSTYNLDHHSGIFSVLGVKTLKSSQMVALFLCTKFKILNSYEIVLSYNYIYKRSISEMNSTLGKIGIAFVAILGIGGIGYGAHQSIKMHNQEQLESTKESLRSSTESKSISESKKSSESKESSEKEQKESSEKEQSEASNQSSSNDAETSRNIKTYYGDDYNDGAKSSEAYEAGYSLDTEYAKSMNVKYNADYKLGIKNSGYYDGYNNTDPLLADNEDYMAGWHDGNKDYMNN